MKTVTEKDTSSQQSLRSMELILMARSKERIQMWKDGDWNFDDYESDYGEYNEVHR